MKSSTGIGGMAILLIGLSTFGFGTQEGHDHPPEIGAPAVVPLESSTAIMKAYRDDLATLEARVVTLRTAVEGDLGDTLRQARSSTRRALAELDEARQVRGQAELALLEYLDQTFPAQERAHLDQIEADEESLRRARNQWEYFGRPANRGAISPADRQQLKLQLEQAESGVKEARKRLEVLRTYTKARSTHELAAFLARTVADEAVRQATWEELRDAEAALERQAGEGTPRTPEDRVIALLDEVIALDGRLVATLRDVKPPGDPRASIALEGARAEAKRLADAATSKLGDAVMLAEQVRAQRVELRDAEVQLRRARKALAAIEARFSVSAGVP